MYEFFLHLLNHNILILRNLSNGVECFKKFILLFLSDDVLRMSYE